MNHPIVAYLFIAVAIVGFVGFFGWKIATQARAVRNAERGALELPPHTAIVQASATPAPPPVPFSVATTTGALAVAAATASASTDAGTRSLLPSAPTVVTRHRPPRRSMPVHSQPRPAVEDIDGNPYASSPESTATPASPSAAPPPTEPDHLFDVRN